MAILLTGTNVHLQWYERNKGRALYVDGRILVVNIRGNCRDHGTWDTGQR